MILPLKKSCTHVKDQRLNFMYVYSYNCGLTLVIKSAKQVLSAH